MTHGRSGGVLFNPHLHFGEAYMAGTLEYAASSSAVLEAISRLSLLPTRLERISLHVQRANSLQQSRRNVHHHYDLGNDFYAGWLDDQMLYTCAYFDHPDVTARGGAGGENGSRLPEAAAAAAAKP